MINFDFCNMVIGTIEIVNIIVYVPILQQKILKDKTPNRRRYIHASCLRLNPGEYSEAMPHQGENKD